MDRSQSQLARISLSANAPFVVIVVESAQGSTPREAGATMVVTAATAAGTIGGGRLEWDAIAAARDMIADQGNSRTKTVVRRLDVSLGPAIGQCCGGRVVLSLTMGDQAALEWLMSAESRGAATRRSVYIYGAGHVGRALALALAPLPFRVVLADVREEELGQVSDDRIERVLASSLSDLVAAAPDGAAHVVMTHSHALDSVIAAAVLDQNRYGYLGLIGSQTKKVLFFKAFREMGIAENLLSSVRCPIGGDNVRDKRPAVIAALAAAEIVTALASNDCDLGGGDTTG